MNACIKLEDRAIVAVGGSEANTFLQGILTCNVDNIGENFAGFGGLLTPQGKILFDFFVVHRADGYLLDVRADMAQDLLRRLMFYRLRADVSLKIIDDVFIFALWGNDNKPESSDLLVTDPRHEKLGWRIYGSEAPKGVMLSTNDHYQKHRVEIGMPAGGVDYEYGKAFPHEALFDQIAGVDFAKGCYVGQEVISRMHHRSTARKRVIQVSANVSLPVSGSTIKTDGKSVGEIKSTSGNNGLALLRLDRVRDAMDAGQKLVAEEVTITPQIQTWAKFDWPAK